MTRTLQSVREAGILIVVAAALGLIYSASTERGLFARTAQSPETRATIGAGPQMISRETADSLFQTGSALFVDARHAFDYKAGHIRGAISLPLAEFDTRKAILDSIPKDRLMVVYCDGAECNSSIELSVRITKEGFTDVRIFFGGWREWVAANLPTERLP